ncbi:MAG: class I SAM-dependent methyltransferase [Candidatus Nanohaloarchaea archaeon]
MEDHIFEPEMAEKLEHESRYRFVSREELLEHIDFGDKVIDVGSGTGFFTDDMAENAAKVLAIDPQPEMHDYYQKKGVPENVELVNSRAADIENGRADTVVSIFSFHEIDAGAAVERFAEALKPDGLLVVYDWSSRGSGDSGPPLEKRFDSGEVREKVSIHMEVLESVERDETFRLVAEPF